MKILVTGGTGYIGSHTVVELQQHGFKVIIVDNLSNSSIEVLDNIRSITGIQPIFEMVDLTDGTMVHHLFEKYNDIIAVIHFAAFKSVSESVEKPLMYYQNNLFSLINLLREMLSHEIHLLVFSSSCTVYGQPAELPVKEESPVQKPFSPYGNTKKISEEIIDDVVKVSSLRAISLRYFNPVGAHESAKIGELPIGVPNNLVPLITQTAVGIRDYLNVYGNDYPTPDGTPIRDYIHVVDLAKAHVVALNRMLNDQMKTPYEIFNLGTGKGYSVLEVIRSFEKVSGKKLNYRIVGRRPGDVTAVWADTSYANQELGWKAEKDLDQMMDSAWKWQLSLTEKKYQSST